MGRLVGQRGGIDKTLGLRAGGSPESPLLPGSFCSSHTSKHGFLSQAWICFRHYIYTPQRGMEWGAEVQNDR